MHASPETVGLKCLYGNQVLRFVEFPSKMGRELRSRGEGWVAQLTAFDQALKFRAFRTRRGGYEAKLGLRSRWPGWGAPRSGLGRRVTLPRDPRSARPVAARRCILCIRPGIGPFVI